MRTVIAVILVLASGPLLGFAMLWFGCSATSILGSFCGHNALLTFVLLVVLGWVATTALLVALSGRKAS